MHRLLRAFAIIAVCAGAVIAILVPAPPAGAISYAQITGSGSSWASNELNQSIADVNRQGLQVLFTAGGSAQGRRDFSYRTTDFGVSDVPFQGHDSVTGADDTSLGRPFAYLPIVAGGTSFPYHVGNGAGQIRNLRLSGMTLARIFTNQINNWDDPVIAAENPQVILPDLPIKAVVHSEGSGATAQFTAYLANQFPSVWSPFSGSGSSTEYFPRQGNQVAQNGSDGVMNYITSAAGNGTIGLDEYSYALLSNYPVAKVLNTAGYYTAPTQYNVAIALTAATINEDPTSVGYLTQNLDAVYTNPDPRTYPISSYSYMILPTGANGAENKTTTTAQRQALAAFAFYSVCTAQGNAGRLGYAPLPLNLVTAALRVIAKLHDADPNVDLSSLDLVHCTGNPTFSASDPARNLLGEIAPQPSPCDSVAGAPTCVGIPTTTTLAIVYTPVAGTDANLRATVSPVAALGSVAFYDNGSSTPLSGNAIPGPGDGTYDLDLPRGFAGGLHSILARFTPSLQSPSGSTAYQPSQSSPLTFNVMAIPVPATACQSPGSICTDLQNVEAVVPVGTLVLSTPYTESTPLNIGTLALQPDAGEFRGSATFNNIQVTDTRAGNLPWTVTGQSSALSDGGTASGSVINAQDIGLTGLVGGSASAGFIGYVTRADNPAAEPAAGPSAALGAAGHQGLGLVPHTILTADHGEGTFTVSGTLTITAPTSTEAGLFTGTITFTVG
jgi:phosphate transport system substrate-binding protein